MSQLKSIQALRAIAALSVMIAHLYGVESNQPDATPLLPTLVLGGMSGVDLFFVISGFIIVWVAGDLEPGAKSSASFLYARVTRIYPTWWLFAGALVVYLYITQGVPWDASSLEPLSVGGLEHLIKSALLIPHESLPVLNLGWTLVHEMYFYIVFAGFIFMPAAMRAPAMGVWAATLIAGMMSGWSTFHASTLVSLIFYPMTLEFLMGAAVGWTLKSGWTRFALPALIIGLVGMGYALYRVDMLSLEQTLPVERTLYFGVSAALIVYGFAALELRSQAKSWIHPVLVRIGNWSYSLYLSHLIVIAALAQWYYPLFGQSPLSSFCFIILASASAIAVAGLAYNLFERPTIRLFRKWGPKSNYRAPKPERLPID